MSFETVKTTTFSRRLFIILVFKIIILTIILGRFIFLQLIKHKEYKERSIKNYSKYFIIPPDRGIIYDCNGKKIAYNASYWRVIHKNIKKDPETIAKTLDIIGISAKNKEIILKEYTKHPFEEFIVYEYLTPQQITNIELNLKNLDGIFTDTGQARHYKDVFAYSNLIGYVKYPTTRDLQSGISSHPDIKVGAKGLERYYNQSLTGKPGMKSIEVNAYGHKIKDLSYQKQTAGESLNLTIDGNLQEFMYKATGKMAMSSVVIDIPTGNILALISCPTFNVEKLSQKISEEEWNAIIENPKKPMFNRAYQAQYALGSIFKIIVATTALKHKVDPNQTFKCTGKHRIGNRIVRCWKEEGHGMMNLHDAIKNSCNVYFYNMVEFLDASQIREVAHIFGLEQIYKNLPFEDQTKGIIPDAHWAKLLQKSWYKGDLANMVIGQGSVMSTSLQLAIMIARLASGKEVIPNLIQGNEQTFEDLTIDKEIIEKVQKGVYAVVNEKGGTSYWQRIWDKNFQYAGKTGTAQVVSKYVKKGDKYTVEHEKPHGLFTGYAPFSNPKYAIATICENGGYGSSSALPFSKKVLVYLKERDEKQNKKSSQ